MSFRLLTIPVFLIFIALIPKPLFGQSEIRHSIYLIGDAGKDTLPGPALQLLGQQLAKDSLSTVIFLGDNVYPAGLEGKDGNKKLRASEMKLLAQLSQTKNHRGNVFWVPGNHDWKAGKWDGLNIVKREAEFVEAYYRDSTSIKNAPATVFMPKDGFPGPVHQIIEVNIHIIAIDVQWWLQAQFFHKVPKTEGLTRRQMERVFLSNLDSLLKIANTAGDPVLIAAHHPLYSNGHHGAPKQPFRFILNWIPPFQLFGLIGLNRAMVQDIPQMRYKRIRKRILKVLNKYQDVVYVSGHDHNLQYFHKDGNHHLISGAGSKRSSLKRDRHKARFMDDRNYGFMRLDLMTDGSMKCHAFGHEKGDAFYSFGLD